ITGKILQIPPGITQTHGGIEFSGQSMKFMAIGEKNGHFCHFIITGQINLDHWRHRRLQDGIDRGYNFQ
ncbi:MAG TPA: hypothetical protein VJR94_12290, partial [Candidatus Nitrosocosmicus sp.]|nr:hypothetical protein [Candidatus Nitrosocosmicus sp.]